MDIGDPDDDATNEKATQQHDNGDLVQEKKVGEGTPVRTPHYGVGQLQSPLRCDPAHDKKHDQIQPGSQMVNWLTDIRYMENMRDKEGAGGEVTKGGSG